VIIPAEDIEAKASVDELTTSPCTMMPPLLPAEFSKDVNIQASPVMCSTDSQASASAHTVTETVSNTVTVDSQTTTPPTVDCQTVTVTTVTADCQTTAPVTMDSQTAPVIMMSTHSQTSVLTATSDSQTTAPTTIDNEVRGCVVQMSEGGHQMNRPDSKGAEATPQLCKESQQVKQQQEDIIDAQLNASSHPCEARKEAEQQDDNDDEEEHGFEDAQGDFSSSEDEASDEDGVCPEEVSTSQNNKDNESPRRYTLTHAFGAALNTAKEVFHSLQYVPPQSNTWNPPSQSEWTPPPQWSPETVDEEHQPQTSMTQLLEMGFANRAQNEALLDKHNGDVEKVIQELITGTENDWHVTRH